MKGILAFDQMNDVAFIKLDADLEAHLARTATNQGLMSCATENCEPSASANEPGPAFPSSSSSQRWLGHTSKFMPNVIIQLFSPLLTSQYIMQNQFRNAYSSIVCEDGLRVTFSIFSGHQFLAISDDNEESEELASRRLRVFVRLLKMLYGISLKALKMEYLSGTNSRPKLLSSLVNKWEKLRSEDQSFLVEDLGCGAVICSISISPADESSSLLSTSWSSLNSMSSSSDDKSTPLASSRSNTSSNIRIRKRVVLAPPAPFDKNPIFNQHGILSDSIGLDRILESSWWSEDVCAIERVLVNRTLNLICIKLLEHVLDSMKRTLSAPYTVNHSFILIGTKLLSFYSSRNTSTLSPSDLMLLTILANTVHSQDRKLKHVGITSSLQLSVETSACERNIDYSSEPNSDSSRLSRIRRGASFIKKIYKYQPKDTSMKCINQHMDISYHLLFLQTANGSSVPHIVYNLRIASGMVLVIICETGKELLSKSLVTSMDILLAIKAEQNTSRSIELGNLLETSLNRVFKILNQYQLNAETQKVVKLAAYKWEQLLQLKFLDFFRKPEQYQLNAKTEAALSSLCDVIREIFHLLVYIPELIYEKYVQTYIEEMLISLQRTAQIKLADYIDYLLIKSTQNLTMTTYAHDYPGLLHFIYIDRTNNIVLAPCMSKDGLTLPEESSEYDTDLTAISHAKVWHMMEFTQRQIHLGHTSVMWKDQNHYCTYFLWFEDRMGNSLSPKNTSINFNQLPLPGILNGDFYKRYTQECFPDAPPGSIHCYELLCVHVGAASVAFVINLCRRLAAQLWEISGNTTTPIPV